MDAHRLTEVVDIGANPIEGSKGNIGGDLSTTVRASANGKVFAAKSYGIADQEKYMPTTRGLFDGGF